MKKFLKPFCYAFSGIFHCFFKQRNFKIQVSFLLLTVALSFWLHISLAEWLVVIICCVIVLAGEMFNTAIEKLCDFINPSINPQIKFIRDVAAGAVLLLSVGAALCGVLIFIPKLYELFIK